MHNVHLRGPFSNFSTLSKPIRTLILTTVKNDLMITNNNSRINITPKTVEKVFVHTYLALQLPHGNILT